MYACNGEHANAHTHAHVYETRRARHVCDSSPGADGEQLLPRRQRATIISLSELNHDTRWSNGVTNRLRGTQTHTHMHTLDTTFAHTVSFLHTHDHTSSHIMTHSHTFTYTDTFTLSHTTLIIYEHVDGNISKSKCESVCDV